jgi:hypothetical protein
LQNRKIRIHDVVGSSFQHQDRELLASSVSESLPPIVFVAAGFKTLVVLNASVALPESFFSVQYSVLCLAFRQKSFELLVDVSLTASNKHSPGNASIKHSTAAIFIFFALPVAPDRCLVCG